MEIPGRDYPVPVESEMDAGIPANILDSGVEPKSNVNQPASENNAVSVVTDPFDDRYQTACFWGSVEPSLRWQTFAILTPCNPGGITVEDTATFDLLKILSTKFAAKNYPRFG